MTTRLTLLLGFVFLLVVSLVSCARTSTIPEENTQITSEADPQEMDIQEEDKQYEDMFQTLLGKSEEEVQAKINTAWNHLFYGDDETERVYYEVEDDMAYIIDINNNDVRSEGISYGMMIAVQMDKQAEFDRIWKWAKTYMYQTERSYA